MSGAEVGADRPPVSEREARRHGGPLLLEFVGLPGAGKTAVAARLVSELRARGLSCAERRGGREPQGTTTTRGLQRAVALLRNYQVTLAALAFAVTVRPMALTPVARALRLSGWTRQLQAYGASDVDVVVLDQGPVQDAWSMIVPARGWGRPEARAVVRRLMSAGGMPRAFVYVDVDTETASQRLRRRRGTSSRFDRLTATQTRLWLVRYERSLSSVFQYAVAAADAPVMRVDGTLPLDVVCRHVARFLDGVRGGSAECVPSATVAAEDVS